MLKIFLMTKNEESMIEDWICYHGHLFGFENLYIIDGSDNQRVIDIYKKYTAKGLNLQHSDANLNEITKILNETMRRYKGEDNFLIKLDTDEFIAYSEPFYSKSTMIEQLIKKAYVNKRRISYSAVKFYLSLRHGNKSPQNHDINNKLKALPLTGQKYKASFTAWAIPVNFDFVDRPCSTISSFTPLQFTHQKSFFHSSSFVSVDLGGHAGVTTQNKGVIDTGLVIIHYASISVKDSMRRARQALVSHGYINEADTLEQCRSKLLKLERGCNSCHKVFIYLKYIEASLSNSEFSPSVLNEAYWYYHKTNKVTEITLVRDTLNKLNCVP